MFSVIKIGSHGLVIQTIDLMNPHGWSMPQKSFRHNVIFLGNAIILSIVYLHANVFNESH